MSRVPGGCSHPVGFGWLGEAGKGHPKILWEAALGLDILNPAPSPVPGRVQGQVGWSSEQPGLVEDVPADGRGAGTR